MMRQQSQNPIKLPRQLLQELGVQGESYVLQSRILAKVKVDDRETTRRIKRTGPAARKELRKASRVQKKSNRTPLAVQSRPLKTLSSKTVQGGNVHSLASQSQDLNKPLPQNNGLKSILKKSTPILSSNPSARRQEPSPSLSPTPEPPIISRGVKDRLAADDAEIIALERALGLKGRKKIPKPLEEGDFDTLLDGLGEAEAADDAQSGKRKRHEEEEWLRRKRRKALGDNPQEPSDGSGEDFSDDPSGGEEMDCFESDPENDGLSEVDVDDDDRSDPDFASDIAKRVQLKSRQPVRENPYVAPSVPGEDAAPAKYVPPSRRSFAADGESISRLRRQLQGSLNRLSEATLIPILGDIEKLYRDNPRQHVSGTLLDLLIGLLCDPTSLQETFIILHAGFIAAVYKIIGTDFGAQAVQRIDQEVSKYYDSEADDATQGKRSANLVSLLAELYNFGVISSGLIYDFVRLFLGNMSETSTELLLKIIRSKHSNFKPSYSRTS